MDQSTRNVWFFMVCRLRWYWVDVLIIVLRMNPKERRKMLLKNKQEDELKRQKEKIGLLGGRYQIEGKIGEGVSSKVFSAVDIHSGQRVAIKKIKNFLSNKHESLRILREILLLRKLKHPNVINLIEIILENEEATELSLVLQFLPTDAKKVFKSNTVLHFQSIKVIIYQILLGLNFLQQCQVLHRDLKPENVLINKDLTQVKLCDFGLARAVTLEEDKDENEMKNEAEEKPVEHSMKGQEEEKQKKTVTLTAHVSTRWYRAPELIILERKYSNAIDIWSVGCIFGELMTMTSNFTERKPLFPGKACYPLSPPKTKDMDYKKINDFPHSVYDQLSVIFSIIGTPEDIEFISDQRARKYIKSFSYKERKPFSEIFKFVNPEVESFLQRSLEFNPNKRMTIKQALNHSLFDDIREHFAANLDIKGDPISMELENAEIEDIRKMVIEEYKFYQSQRH